MKEGDINWGKIEREATDYLSQYLQIDTTNPPGNESQGAMFLKELLGREGIPNDIIESQYGRGNLIARLKGNGSKLPLLLLSHIDVVPAEGEKWSHPPFSGKLVDGEIWGRGALDCKSLGIMEAMVLIQLKKTGCLLSRDVIMAATADEEKGGTFGVGWLCKNRPELQEVEAVINEGGGVGLPGKRNNYYLCQVAEKGVCWIRIKFTGNPGHASIPREDNCILSLGQSLDTIGKYRSRIQIPPLTKKFIQRFSGDEELAPILKKLLQEPLRADEALKNIPDRGFKQLLETMIRNTFVPTVVKGGEKTNVIPSECFCEIDCRMLPGETSQTIQKEIEKILKGIPGCSIHITQSSTPSESNTSHELFQTFEHSLTLHDPKSKLIPFISSGATDSRFFRNEQTSAFGFAPLLVDGDFAHYQDMVHGHNERISRKNLVFGIKVLYDAVRKYCA